MYLDNVKLDFFDGIVASSNGCRAYRRRGIYRWCGIPIKQDKMMISLAQTPLFYHFILSILLILRQAILSNFFNLTLSSYTINNLKFLIYDMKNLEEKNLVWIKTRTLN